MRRRPAHGPSAPAPAGRAPTIPCPLARSVMATTAGHGRKGALMKRLLALLLLLGAGCQTSQQALTVVGSAYVETERPEGKAVAKLEVRYTPGSKPARETDDKDRTTKAAGHDDAEAATLPRPPRKPAVADGKKARVQATPPPA